MTSVNIIHVGNDTALYVNTTQIMTADPAGGDLSSMLEETAGKLSLALGTHVNRHEITLNGDWNWDEAKKCLSSDYPPVFEDLCYKAFSLSTDELLESDVAALEKLCFDRSCNCFVERETGYLIKLDANHPDMNKNPLFSDQLNFLIAWAFQNDCRLLEFDQGIETSEYNDIPYPL